MANPNFMISGGNAQTSEAIDRGLLVYRPTAGGTISIADDGANQAATQQLVGLGVAWNSVNSGGTLEVQYLGEAEVTAGTGGLAVGDQVVAENATGKGIAMGTAASGDTIYGECIRAASANGAAIVRLNIRTVD